MAKLIFICNCGAVTVEHKGKKYCMEADDLGKHFQSLEPVVPILVRDCNYCMNGWGVDLCGCGSGEKFGKCKNGLEFCKSPIQDIVKGISKPI